MSSSVSVEKQRFTLCTFFDSLIFRLGLLFRLAINAVCSGKINLSTWCIGGKLRGTLPKRKISLSTCDIAGKLMRILPNRKNWFFSFQKNPFFDGI